MDEPVSDEPLGDEPVGDEPVGDEPVGDEPVGDEPVGDEPVTQEPVTDDVTAAQLVAQLVRLEAALWRSLTRFDRAWMARVLHPDFHELGRSGRRWSREEILDVPAVDVDVAWPPSHLHARLVAPDVALLTYVVVDAAGTASNRSSLWLREPAAEDDDPSSGWRLRFHQGGPTSL